MLDYNVKRVMFDTNILFDIVCPERPQSEEACKAVDICNGGGWMGFVTAGSLKDLYYTLSKQRGEQLAREAVEAVADSLIVAPCGGEAASMSLYGDEPDFEDGLIRACAELNDVEYILSRDKEAFEYSKVKKLDCVQFVELVERQHKIDYKTLLCEQ